MEIAIPPVSTLADKRTLCPGSGVTLFWASRVGLQHLLRFVAAL